MYNNNGKPHNGELLTLHRQATQVAEDNFALFLITCNILVQKFHLPDKKGNHHYNVIMYYLLFLYYIIYVIMLCITSYFFISYIIPHTCISLI